MLGLRHSLETALEDRLRSRWEATGPTTVDAPGDVPAALAEVVAADDGPSLADHVRRRADREEVLELLRQRSIYHLKESDPSAFVVHGGVPQSKMRTWCAWIVPASNVDESPKYASVEGTGASAPAPSPTTASTPTAAAALRPSRDAGRRHRSDTR